VAKYSAKLLDSKSRANALQQEISQLETDRQSLSEEVTQLRRSVENRLRDERENLVAGWEIEMREQKSNMQARLAEELAAAQRKLNAEIRKMTEEEEKKRDVKAREVIALEKSLAELKAQEETLSENVQRQRGLKALELSRLKESVTQLRAEQVSLQEGALRARATADEVEAVLMLRESKRLENMNELEDAISRLRHEEEALVMNQDRRRREEEEARRRRKREEEEDRKMMEREREEHSRERDALEEEIGVLRNEEVSLRESLDGLRSKVTSRASRGGSEGGNSSGEEPVHRVQHLGCLVLEDLKTPVSDGSDLIACPPDETEENGAVKEVVGEIAADSSEVVGKIADESSSAAADISHLAPAVPQGGFQSVVEDGKVVGMQGGGQKSTVKGMSSLQQSPVEVHHESGATNGCEDGRQDRTVEHGPFPHDCPNEVEAVMRDEGEEHGTERGDDQWKGDDMSSEQVEKGRHGKMEQQEGCLLRDEETTRPRQSTARYRGGITNPHEIGDRDEEENGGEKAPTGTFESAVQHLNVQRGCARDRGWDGKLERRMGAGETGKTVPHDGTLRAATMDRGVMTDLHRGPLKQTASPRPTSRARIQDSPDLVAAPLVVASGIRAPDGVGEEGSVTGSSTSSSEASLIYWGVDTFVSTKASSRGRERERNSITDSTPRRCRGRRGVTQSSDSSASPTSSPFIKFRGRRAAARTSHTQASGSV
jgi:hypothetical protein